MEIKKVAVVGAGIVGVPMAALLAQASIEREDLPPYRVVLIQRDSPTSGWKVAAINSGKSPIGGIEPELDRILAKAHHHNRLSSSHDYQELSDADAILICVQTDKKGLSPDYGPLENAIDRMAVALKNKPAGKNPLIIFESTLAPTSMATLITRRFNQFGFVDGKNIHLGNSPNRVMPGRLVERIRESDKLAGGLNPNTSNLIYSLYSRIVTKGKLHLTNSLTAEVVKTLENAYRDVRIAYSAEIARACEKLDFDYYLVRDEVNRRLSWNDAASTTLDEVPSGGLLIPTIGVGGHCLPKDGVLLLWRQIESGIDLFKSLILEARKINDESPHVAISHMEGRFGKFAGKNIALMGAAYRANSEDTRNSPTFVMARLLLDQGSNVIIHDPYVKPDDQNLIRAGLTRQFTRDDHEIVTTADVLVYCVPHLTYLESIDQIVMKSSRLSYVYDGCNLFSQITGTGKKVIFERFGHRKNKATQEFMECVYRGFLAVEKGFANEIDGFICFANDQFVSDGFNRAEYQHIKALASTCVTGCRMGDPGPVSEFPASAGFSSRLVQRALLGGMPDGEGRIS